MTNNLTKSIYKRNEILGKSAEIYLKEKMKMGMPKKQEEKIGDFRFNKKAKF